MAADYFAAKRLRKLAEVEELIVASALQLAYGLTVHLENSSSRPGRRHSASGFLCKFELSVVTGLLPTPPGAPNATRTDCFRERPITGVATRLFAPSEPRPHVSPTEIDAVVDAQARGER